MSRFCKINGCTSRFFKGTDISFFSVPLSNPQRKLWIDSVEKFQSFDYIVQSFHVCSLHFSPNDLNINGKRKTVIPGRFPTIFPNQNNKKSTGDSSNLQKSNVDGNCGIDNLVPSMVSDVHSNDHDFQCSDIEDNILESSDGINNLFFNESGQNFNANNIPTEQMKLISADKYKELLYAAAELGQYKIANEKMKNSLQTKSAEIKQLKKNIRRYENSKERNVENVETNEVDEPKISSDKEIKQLEILKCLQFGSSTKKYSENVRLFCMTMHFYSPKAYEYIRSTFDCHLPAVRTLRSWYSSVDCSPGFTESSFDALRERAEEYKSNGKQLKVGVIFDAMYIRQHSQWDHSKKEFLGHDTVGNKSAQTLSKDVICTPLSTQVLAFMVSGIDEEFKITIAYFYNTSLTGEEQAALLDDALFRLKKVDVTVVSFTFDGDRKNIKTLEILGARYDDDQPYFRNPYDKDNTIYAIFDPPHVLKLARNCLGNKGVLFDNENNEIRWQLFTKLVEFQISHNINLGNKVNKKHVEFESNKMNVRLAAETLSNSTANSIEYMDTQIENENFANSKPTTKYFRTWNNLFDIMNTKKNHCDQVYKRPFSDETIDVFVAYFNENKDYIKGFKVMEKGKIISIFKTPSFTPFFAILHNMTSFVGLYKDYVKNDSGIFYPFSVSQDHLESYFGCVRRMGSTNDNPSQQQFTGAYRKLLFQNEVTSSHKSNCQNDITKMLTVSSRRKVPTVSINPEELRLLQSYDFENICNDEYNLVFEDEKNPTEILKENSLAYLGGVIETKVIRKISSAKNACQRCINVFVENEITDDSFMTFLSQKSSKIIQPCKSTIKILKTIENLLKNYQSGNISYKTTVTYILNNIDISQLYSGSDFQESHNHQRSLVQRIVETYLDHKSKMFSKTVTTMSQKKLIRHDRLKLVHELGQ